MMQNYKYLQFAPFQSMTEWSVTHLLNRDLGFTERYPFVRIGDVIQRNAILVTVKDDVSYKQITLKTNGGGAVLRDIKLGKDIKTKKQYLAKEGQFIMSKIDARNGAFGVVTKELDGAIVTAEFPLFDVDAERISPVYLSLLSATKPFVEYAQSCSRGTTNRRRIDLDSFLSQQIPLPSLVEQNEIISEYNTAVKQAEICAKQADSIDDRVSLYWQKVLGVDSQKEITAPKIGYLEFYPFKYFEKWGYDFIRKENKNKVNAKYSYVRIVDVCDISSGGTPSRSRNEYYKGNIPWVKTRELKNEELFDTEEKITALGLEKSSAKLYPKGSIVVAMYGATIGRTAKLGVQATTNQACAVLFNIQTLRVSVDYLWQFIQSQTDNLKSMAYGGAQPNINASIIANYNIPLPPLNIQNKIVARINAFRVEQKRLHLRSSELREQAEMQLERKIFNK